ncbi:hypothetical protein QWZ03_01620 [Chitinimonas viridis]|uniref:Uncharacterized protein n=1 Tax=Chitinimonas viridis TaxID=664880 RepID=A0ABT8AZQ6_9NEIS|nr:hypothetical protein [Chitinimonas viridis]MDN3575468.1 hypothetical protein [Chitinimonas viridis]
MPQVINRPRQEDQSTPATDSTATSNGSDPASPAPAAVQQLDMLIGAMAGFAPVSMGSLAASGTELASAPILMAVPQP